MDGLLCVTHKQRQATSSHWQHIMGQLRPLYARSFPVSSPQHALPLCRFSTLESYNILWKAHFLSITLEWSCWWPHKSHVNELWERPISHHARCALPLLFMAIIGPCFLRQWLCTDGSDDDSAQRSGSSLKEEGGEGGERKFACEGEDAWIIREERLC